MMPDEIELLPTPWPQIPSAANEQQKQQIPNLRDTKRIICHFETIFEMQLILVLLV